MKSPHQRQAEQKAAQQAADAAQAQKLNVKNNKLDTQSKKQVAILWNKLDHSIAPRYLSATQEANTAYIYNQNAIQELKSYSSAAKMAAYMTFLIVFIAATMDALLWYNLFKNMDGVANANMARAIGLTVAIFGTIVCAVLGRAIKQKSTHEEGMREDASGVSQYDKFTPFQKEVFDKNTTHDMLKLSLFTLGLCSLIIPFVRWTSLDSTKSTLDKVQSVAILSAVSYFIFAAVILLEIYNHCTWTRELNISHSDYKGKVASHSGITKRANAIGKQLIKISLAEKETFKAFMSNKDYQLLNENTVDTQPQIHTIRPSKPKPSNAKPLSVIEDDNYLSM
jgi:hypothetical protein